MATQGLASPHDQGATFVELFFDLVFVFAVTEVTHFTATHLDVGGVLRAILVFWLVWWAWTQFTWALNAADTDHHEVRLGTLISTAVAFVMAASVEQAYSDDVLWFVVPYIGVRLLGLGLYYRVASHDPAQRSAVAVFAIASLAGLAAVLAGGLLDPALRPWLWLGAIGLDVVAAHIGGRQLGWNLHAGHFAERHGLIVIIALGESLIVAGSAVASDARAGGLIAAGATVVVATCLLWWTYFGWAKEEIEEGLLSVVDVPRTQMARDAFSLWHFPLVCGIIAFAVGVEGILAHPDEPASLGVVIALGTGVLLFVGSTAGALWRTRCRVHPLRLLIPVGILAVLILSASAPPVWLVVEVIVGLTLIVAIEHFGLRGKVRRQEA